MRKKAAIVLIVTLVVVGALSFGTWKGCEWLVTRIAPSACHLQMDGAEEPLRLTNERTRSASIIVAKSYSHGLPEQAVVIALAMIWQESGLRNLNYGDCDSLGLFQQRLSYDWGTKERIISPWYSSERFYEELIKFSDWRNTNVNDITQKVQRSGHPETYRKHETSTRALVKAFRRSKEGIFTYVNRDATRADHSNLDKVVATVPGDSFQNSGSKLTMTTSNAGTAWLATQLALANASGLGIKKVSVDGNEWEQGERTWRDVQPVSGGSMTATIKLRS